MSSVRRNLRTKTVYYGPVLKPMKKLLLLLVSVLPVSAANVQYTVEGLLGGTLDFIASDFLRNLPPTKENDQLLTWDLPDQALLSSPCRNQFRDRQCTS